MSKLSEQNILEIIESKLLTFRKKKKSLEEQTNNKLSEVEEIKSNIKSLEINLENTLKTIQNSQLEIEKIDKLIEEIDNGYSNLVESGQCLMSIINNAQE